MEWFLLQILKLLGCFAGAGLTVFVANTFAHQHWTYWPVFLIWVVVVFVGFLIVGGDD